MFDRFRRKNKDGKFTKPYYSIISIQNGKAIDLSQDKVNQDNTVLWEGHGGKNQIFTLKKKGQFYLLKCKQGRKYLTVEGPQNGARIVGTKKTKSQNQRFTIDERVPGSNEYIIRTYCGKVLDCEGKGNNNGTRVVQWDYNGGPNQLWKLADPKDFTSSSSDSD